MKGGTKSKKLGLTLLEQAGNIEKARNKWIVTSDLSYNLVIKL